MRDSGAAQGVITFRQVGQVLKGGWAVVLLCLLLGIASSAALFLAVPESFTSDSVVSLSPGIVTSSSSSKDISTATQSAIASSTAVADRAAPLLNWPGDATKLLDNVSVTSPLDSQVLRISYSASTAAGAAAGANAFATAYLAYSTDTARSLLQARLDRIGQQISELQKTADAKATIIASPSSSQAKITAAKLQQSSLARQLNQLQDQQASIATTTISAGHVVNKGFPPLAADFSLKIFLLAGSLLGLVLGVLITLVRNLGTTKVRDAVYLEERFTIPVLESVPEPRSSKGESTDFGVLDDLAGLEADAYRSLAAKMTVGTAPSGTRLLLVPASGLGTATTPLSLAVTLAAQGQRVLLLGSRETMNSDCMLLGPDYVVAEEVGMGVQELYRKGGLRVVSFGEEVSLVATLRSRGDAKLAAMLEQIDILLIDGINVVLGSTSLNLARLADEALVVVRAGETRVPGLHKSLHELQQVGLPVQGIVLLVPTRTRRGAGEEREVAPAPEPPGPSEPSADSDWVRVRSSRSRS